MARELTLKEFEEEFHKLIPFPEKLKPSEIKAAAIKLAEAHGMELRIVIHVHCSFPPLKCSWDISITF